MGVALTLIFVFAFSSTIVRVAGVVLEHTGIARDVARFQTLSALSGTGFTTSESELLLRTQAGRRVLTYLIILGNLGLASIAATVIIGAFNISDDTHGLIKQVIAILAAGLLIRFILTNQKLDNFVCAAANNWLVRQKVNGQSYTVLSVLSPGQFIAEHSLNITSPIERTEIERGDLVVLGVRGISLSDMQTVESKVSVATNERLILWGSERYHDAIAAEYGNHSVIASDHQEGGS